MNYITADLDNNNLAPISEEDWKDVLNNKLKKGKASDIYGMAAENLQFLSPTSKEIMRRLINEVVSDIKLYSETVRNLRVATMLYKGKNKDKKLIKSYRRISVGTVFNKAIDVYLSANLNKILKENQSRRQFGFTAQVSAGQCILLRDLTIRYSVSMNQPLYYIAADVENAFCRVTRLNSLHCLYRHGQKSKLYQYTARTFTNTCSYVKDKGKLSSLILEKVGEAQGGNMSASNFKAFNSPLTKRLEYSGIGFQMFDQKWSIILGRRLRHKGYEISTSV